MKHYQIIQEALDKATQSGSFNLQETGLIFQAVLGLQNDLKELEEYRKGALDLKDSPEQEEKSKD